MKNARNNTPFCTISLPETKKMSVILKYDGHFCMII